MDLDACLSVIAAPYPYLLTSTDSVLTANDKTLYLLTPADRLSLDGVTRQLDLGILAVR